MKKLYTAIKKQLENMKTNKRAIESYGKYLEPGKYEYFVGVKPLLIDRNNFPERYYQSFGYTTDINRSFFYKFVAYFKKTYYQFQNNNIEETFYKGDFLMIDRNGDIKIYNFNQKLVLSFIQNTARYEKIKSTYQNINKHCNTPFLKVIDEEQAIVEKFIDSKPVVNWNDEDKKNFHTIFFDILEKHAQRQWNSGTYIETSTLDILKKFEDKVQDKEFIKIVKKLICKESFYKEKWPTIKCHGDFKLDNILLEENNFYLIDWDLYGDYIFFYDFIDLIFIEAYHDNYKYLEDFLKGGFDREIKSIFNVFSIGYETGNKKSYLALYVMEKVLKNNLKIQKDEKLLKESFERYKEILKKINQY